MSEADVKIDVDEWRDLTSKAAYVQGITLLWPSEPDLKPRNARTHETYAPLDDDMQAFRLSNQLAMRIEHGKNHKNQFDRVTVSIPWQPLASATVKYGSDCNAAVRRAISLTAAELYRDG